MSKRRGFTLIELLVVIAIIAILAAILFPVFASVKEKGRQASCLNDMGQLGKAFRMYMDDCGGKYPGGAPLYRFNSYYVPNNITSGPEYVWMIPSSDPRLPGGYGCDPMRGCLARYIRNASVFICPSDKQARQTAFKASYSMNAKLDWLYTPGGTTDSQVIKQSKTVMLVDEGSGSISLTSGQLSKMVDGYFGNWIDSPADAHVGGCNFVFCDGHGAWVKHEAYNKLSYNPAGN